MSENENTGEALKVYVQCLFQRTYLSILENCRKCLSTKICSKSLVQRDEFNKCFECLLLSIFIDGLCYDHNPFYFPLEENVMYFQFRTITSILFWWNSNSFLDTKIDLWKVDFISYYWIYSYWVICLSNPIPKMFYLMDLLLLLFIT